MILMDDIGKRLRELRRKKAASEPHGKLGVRKPAAAAGVSAQTYLNWETKPNPKIEDRQIKALARFYGTTAQYIRFGNDISEKAAIDMDALERALTMFDAVQSRLGASVPPRKRSLVIRQLYERAASGQLDGRTAEDIISLAL